MLKPLFARREPQPAGSLSGVTVAAPVPAAWTEPPPSSAPGGEPPPEPRPSLSDQVAAWWERTHDRIADWWDARSELELKSYGVSLGVHVGLVLVLLIAASPFSTVRYRDNEITGVVNTVASHEELIRIEMEPLGDTSRTLSSSAAPGGTPDLADVAALSVPIASAVPQKPEKSLESLAGPDVQKLGTALLPKPAVLSKDVTIRGSGAEHVGGVEGAVDRIAQEVLRHLEKGRTLLVWSFDSSGSLVAERDRLAKHIERVYQNIDKLDEEKLAQNEALLTAVVAFGSERKVLTAEPTAELPAIASAIASVPLDTTGIETTFETTIDIVRKWGKYRHDGHAYQTMVVIVTDEVGDDEPLLEQAIGAAKSAKVPIYILGSGALFGQKIGFMPYTDPQTKRRYPALPVRQGPESLVLEQIKLPFWYGEPQYHNLDSGFGPYALSRLSGATGGIYFITRLGPGRVHFDPIKLREYRPDWSSEDAYDRTVRKDPLRMAVLNAAQITQSKLPDQPRLDFPPVDGPEFKEAMAKGQELAARTSYTIDLALEPIAAVVKLRDREPSRRWQAHYDLIRGRLLAMKIRCYEYNWACAEMKKNPRRFQNPESNTWKLMPDKEIHYSDKAATAAEEARKLLKRVVDEHPNTPWAILAARELRDPFGFRWEEATAPPVPKPNDNPARKNAMPKGESRPPELPKL